MKLFYFNDDIISKEYQDNNDEFFLEYLYKLPIITISWIFIIEESPWLSEKDIV